MSKTVKIILAAVAASVLLICGAVLGTKLAQGPAAAAGGMAVDSAAEPWQGEQSTYTGEKNVDTIDIPGFDAINLKADATAQAVNLYNPEQNTCYFKISLLLADGTLLWQSDLIEPGMGMYNITLNQPLTAGSYDNATIRYECFAMDEAQTPLNGSEIKLTLNVLN